MNPKGVEALARRVRPLRSLDPMSPSSAAPVVQQQGRCADQMERRFFPSLAVHGSYARGHLACTTQPDAPGSVAAGALAIRGPGECSPHLAYSTHPDVTLAAALLELADC